MKKWFRLPLQEKLKYLTFSAGAVVFLSIAANMLVAFFGLGGFGSILKDNSQSLAFWTSMDEESAAFDKYIQERSDESLETLKESTKHTKGLLNELPFEYRNIGKERYARTWTLRNLYENYEVVLNGLLEKEHLTEEDMPQVYKIRRIQEYLTGQAGQLEQLTVRGGSRAYEQQRYMLTVIPVCSLICGMAAFWMVRQLNRTASRYIVKPIVELAADSVRIGENDFTGPDVVTEGEDEISRLVHEFCRMKASTRDNIRTMEEKHAMEQKLNDMRLQMLKSQINPHFLFNTLNMIASTAQIEDAAATEKMITALSRLFRYNLKSAGAVMPLERELKIIQDYMYLQKMRFGQRVRYDTDCAPETLEVLVPSFVLQPLVENSIKHGLSKDSKGGRIFIRTWMHNGRLWISVADTGAGMEEDRLKQIRAALNHGTENEIGIGVGNIYRRVQGNVRRRGNAYLQPQRMWDSCTAGLYTKGYCDVFRIGGVQDTQQSGIREILKDSGRI